MIKSINTLNVKTFEDAMGELQGLINQLEEAGLSRHDAHMAAYDAYLLGYGRAERVYRGLEGA